MKKTFVFAILTFFICVAPSLALSIGLGNLNLPGYGTIDRINLFVAHRAAGNISDKPFDNMLGTDQGMVASYGFGFRITDWMDLSVVRSNLNQEFFISNKIKFLDGFAFLWGVTNKTTPLITQDKTDYVAQLIFSEEIFKDKFAISFVPTYSNFLPTRPTIAIGMGAQLLLADKFGYCENVEMLGEYTPAFGGYALSNPELAIGIRWRVLSQVMSLMITNVTYTFPNGYILGNDDGAFHLGFNLSTAI